MKTTTEFASGVLVEERFETMHLSEDQIDAQLLGELDVAAAEHLAGCAQCTARVAQAEEPIANFREVTMAWSERRSATMPMPTVAAEGLVWQRRMGWVTAAFVLGVGIAVTNNEFKTARWTASVQQAQTVEPLDAQGQRPAPAAVAAPAQVATMETAEAARNAGADRLSDDNHMLTAIDAELDASVESPAALGLETVSDEQPGDAVRPAARPALQD